MLRYLIAALTLAAVALADDGGWQRIGDYDGIVIDRRAGEGSSIHEVRAAAHSPLPPAAIMATLWKHDEYVQFVPYLRRLDVLREEGDTKLIYEQVHVPPMKDRDTTLRVTRTFSPADGVYRLSSTAVPEEGPPESAAYVRVRTSASRWELAPAADGGTTVTYTIRTDAGGLVPAWIVNLAQRSATAKLVRAMLDRARRNNP
jgi:ribosome-associated toxin RatA of RatAB toxin-antitoxin module